MARYGILIDCDKCIGCYDCFLACQDEFCGNAYPGYSAAAPMAGHNWIRVLDKERGQYPKVKVAYFAKTCMHCEKPKCMEAAQNNAVYKRPDGIVMIDPQKAKGQKQIVDACPYRVIEWNDKEQVAQKCIMCAHLLDKGEKEPRCVESCPTQALIFGDLNDPQSEISRKLKLVPAKALHPEFKMGEKVIYHGLPKRFVSGTVVFKDKNECADNLRVELIQGNEKRTCHTNGFGDFEFENLAANQMVHITINPTGYKKKTIKMTTHKDIHIGEIFLLPEE